MRICETSSVDGISSIQYFAIKLIIQLYSSCLSSPCSWAYQSCIIGWMRRMAKSEFDFAILLLDEVLRISFGQIHAFAALFIRPRPSLLWSMRICKGKNSFIFLLTYRAVIHDEHIQNMWKQKIGFESYITFPGREFIAFNPRELTFHRKTQTFQFQIRQILILIRCKLGMTAAQLDGVERRGNHFRLWISAVFVTADDSSWNSFSLPLVCCCRIQNSQHFTEEISDKAKAERQATLKEQSC